MAHRLAPEAAADLDDIWLYVAERGGVAAAAWGTGESAGWQRISGGEARAWPVPRPIA